MPLSRIASSTLNLTPISYVQGPVPARPSRVGMFCVAGTSSAGKSEQGHVLVVYFQTKSVAPSGVPSAERTEPLMLAAYVEPPISCEDGTRVALCVVSS